MSVKDDRVDLVIADCSAAIGPDQRLVWETATRLSRARFQIEAWLPSESSRDPLAGALGASETAVERLGAARSAWRGWFGAWRKLRRRRPALLHLHRPLGGRLRWALALAELCPEARVVISESALSRSASGPTRLIGRRLAARADALVTDRHDSADRLVRDLGVSRDRIRVLAEGVDLPDEESETEPAQRVRRALGAGVFRPLWVCATPLETGRGHETLLEALARVRDAGLPFVAVWPGDGSHRAELEQRARALSLDDRVRFGSVGATRSVLLSAADLVVVPAARADEADDVVQAMARARPIVAGAASAASELIVNGITGRLVAIENVSELAAALESMARQSDSARRMGMTAAARVGEERSWSRVVEELEAVYDDLLGFATFVPDSAAVSERR
jgi:glycosyltransferase involved in cell wall biosynthesis